MTRCFDITLPSWMVGVSWVGLRFFATCCFNITLPSWMVSVCWVGLRFLCFFDITLIALTDKVLVHLVFPICKIIFIEFLGGNSVSHLSILGGNEHMMQGSTTCDSLLRHNPPKLDGRCVVGWVTFLVLLRHNSNNFDRQGISASCIPKMRSCFCRVSRWE